MENKLDIFDKFWFSLHWKSVCHMKGHTLKASLEPGGTAEQQETRLTEEALSARSLERI